MLLVITLLHDNIIGMERRDILLKNLFFSFEYHIFEIY